MLPQLLANGFVSGCAYALVALGFGLIYNTSRIFHFAHGGVYVVGAYLFYTFWSLWQIPLPVAAGLTVIATGAFGILVYELVYRPLTERGASLVLMLSSLGLYIIIINIIAMIFGNETKVLSPGIQPTVLLAGVILTRVQVVTVIVTGLLFALVVLMMRRLSWGRIARALRDDGELLTALGVNTRLVLWGVFGAGSALAAVAAILVALDIGIDPNIGMVAVLNGAVAVIIGGIGVFEAAAFGGVLLGLLQSLAIWQVSARWQDMVTFIVLILFLLFRPQGTFGRRRRAEELSG